MCSLLSYSRCCGVDVSKDTLDICIMAAGVEVSSHFANTLEGIAGIVQLCREHQVEIVVAEATGGLQRSLALAMISAKISIAVVNPGRIRHYAQAEGMIAKTDKVDARIIALFARKIAPAPTLVRSKEQEELARLAARKLQLTDIKIAENNRLSREVDALVLKSIHRLLAFIEKELGEIDQRLDTLVELDPKLKAKAEAADSVFGVGRASAIALLVFMPEVGTLSSKQAASLAGLAPFNKDSGKVVGQRHIFGGRPAIRTTLYMCALSAIRRDGVLKTFYKRLVDAGKCKMVALTACMRKMMVIINARVREALAAQATCAQ
jgi:transposase